jgi:hypothetical protein
MRIGQTTEAGLYPVEYEKYDRAPHEVLLNEVTIVIFSLSLPPSVIQKLAIPEERVGQFDDLALHIREVATTPDATPPNLEALLQPKNGEQPPKIHQHSIEELGLISAALQLFVGDTPQYLANMESHNVPRPDYATRRTASRVAKGMCTQINGLPGLPDISTQLLMPAETSTQEVEPVRNTGQYL